MQITVEIVKDVYWDNWGNIVKVFDRGDTVTGSARFDANGNIESFSAVSKYHPGISDYLDLDEIRIVEGYSWNR
ncbi:hypothetical protein ABGV42_01085 [Paenibacillus pabuli]|uniref:hypothetical protein n=1 Tax=Paenibacillus pabuli TaxID=1472 RepID=UPI003241E5AC